MQDPLDVSLQDDELLAELELTTSLIIAASALPGVMDPADIDRLLGAGPHMPAQRPTGPLERMRHRHRHDQHLDDHWACWPQWVADRPRLLWYLTFEDQPELTAWVRALHQPLSSVEGVDLVPPQWLHLTVADVAFLDEVTGAEVDALADAARRALHGWRCDPLTFGPPTTMGDAVVLLVSPADALLDLGRRLRGATTSVLGRRPGLVDEVQPHVSVAYSRTAGRRRGLQRSLATVGDPAPPVPLPGLTLAAVTREPPGYRWRSAATVPLGCQV